MNTLREEITALEVKLQIITDCKLFKFEIAAALDASATTENQRYAKYQMNYESFTSPELKDARLARIKYIQAKIDEREEFIHSANNFLDEVAAECDEDAAEEEAAETERLSDLADELCYTVDQIKEIEEITGEITEVETYTNYDMTVISAEDGEYMVGTDEEADEAWDQSLDSYLEDCIYPELPESVRNYFDDDKWKSDAKYDGRGHSLSSYDGNEHETSDLILFRTN